MPKSLTLSFPGSVPSLNRLLHMHWSARGRLQREWDTAAFYLLREAEQQGRWGGQPFLAAGMELGYWFPDANRRDWDNTIGGSKPLIDSLVKSGVLTDDDFRHLELHYRRCGVDKKNPRIEVKIWERGQVDGEAERPVHFG